MCNTRSKSLFIPPPLPSRKLQKGYFVYRLYMQLELETYFISYSSFLETSTVGNSI